MTSATTIPQAVGTFLTRFRKKHSLTLDQVARAAREHGASWSASSVRNIENGTAVTSLPNLLALGLALHALSDEELALSDLLGDSAAFEVPNGLGLPASRAWMNGVLSGAPIRFGDVTIDLIGGKEKAAEIVADLPKRIAKLRLELPEKTDYRLVGKFEKIEPSLAEIRAAEKLGMSPRSLQIWAERLWGKSLEERSAELAAAKANETGRAVTAQAKGAATRTLVKQIAENWEAQQDGSPA